ncbi:MAG: sigma-54-dependent Fis family transcriptional regulator [Armatimonadetes bacterium]|nr:sigma-54-dependent Fis family transcriptional regulator [Armatimonadota bacterium]
MRKKTANILVVDDEPNIRRVLEAVLSKEGHSVRVAENGRKAQDILTTDNSIDVLISDLIMPDINGIELLEAAKEINPSLSVIMITAHGTIQSAVDAMKLGALDYITNPFDLDDIKQVVKNAIARRGMEESKPPSASVTKGPAAEFDMVGSSEAMLDVFRMVDRIKDSRATVLIRGESGTGKEGIARALHFTSVRSAKPFVPVACVALSEQLLQSELFGHEKGSFTGAIGRKKGRFELANQGTLFLDEIGDIPPTVQMMLLRVIQEREFERVGGDETIRVDVRLVTATNQDLEKLVKEGKFREDLFYRLQVVTVNMPPLRDRLDDIPALVERFVGMYAPDNGKKIEFASPETLELFTKYGWPGNVRELENAIERAIVLADPDARLITPDLLPDEIMRMVTIGSNN